ncbi:MAG: hypothetical protein OQJ89_10245, partial [Kangiellaceae bacterium]|nr:hypothetical protein [Kangiellaceae bacterium]
MQYLKKLIFVIMIFSFGPDLIAQELPTKQELLIKNVTLISPERQKPLIGANVYIRDGKILEISTKPIQTETVQTEVIQKGTSQKGSLQSDLKILDASGQYLIPGLMDSHVHISQMPGAPLEITEGSTVRAMVNAFHKQQPR